MSAEGIVGILVRPSGVDVVNRNSTSWIYTHLTYDPTSSCDIENALRGVFADVREREPDGIVVVGDYPFFRRRSGVARGAQHVIDLGAIISRANGRVRRAFVRLPDVVGLNSLVSEDRKPERLLAVTLSKSHSSASALEKQRLTDILRGDFGGTTPTLTHPSHLQDFILQLFNEGEPPRPSQYLDSVGALAQALRGLHSGGSYLGIFSFPFDSVVLQSDQPNLADNLVERLTPQLSDIADVSATAATAVSQIKDFISGRSWSDILKLVEQSESF